MEKDYSEYVKHPKYRKLNDLVRLRINEVDDPIREILNNSDMDSDTKYWKIVFQTATIGPKVVHDLLDLEKQEQGHGKKRFDQLLKQFARPPEYSLNPLPNLQNLKLVSLGKIDVNR